MTEEKRKLAIEALVIKAKLEAMEETVPFLEEKLKNGDREEKMAAAITLAILKVDLEMMTKRALEIRNELDVLEEAEKKDWNEVLKGE